MPLSPAPISSRAVESQHRQRTPHPRALEKAAVRRFGAPDPGACRTARQRLRAARAPELSSAQPVERMLHVVQLLQQLQQPRLRQLHSDPVVAYAAHATAVLCGRS